MEKRSAYFFDKWWIPILFSAFAFIFFIVGKITSTNFLNISGLILFLASLFIILISIIFQLVKRRWWKAILTFLFSIGILGSFLIYLTMSIFAGPFLDGTDRWADNLTIPENIQLDNPIDLASDNGARPDSVFNLEKTTMDFQLYNSFQPGLYEYDFWVNRIEKGIIYLKAYEITQNEALSTNRLPESSSVKVDNPTDNIRRFGTTCHFTIYEGDWGKPYAARFEVWFKPDSGDKERKLGEKNYKIEGWQR